MRLIWGAEAQLDRVESSRIERDRVTGATTTAPPRFPDGSRMSTFAGYLWAELDLAPTLTVSAGGRYTTVDHDIAATADTPSADLTVDDVTGSVGLLWEAVDGIGLATNLSRGFRAPNIFDLGTLGARPGNRFNVPHPDLDAETIHTVDLGLKLARGRLAGEVFAFLSRVDDQIASVPTGETTPEGRQVVRSENLDRVRLGGVEAAASLDLRSDLVLAGHAFWVFGEQEDRTGAIEPGDRVPPLQGRLGLRWDAHPPDGLEELWIEPAIRLALRQDRLSGRDVDDPRIDPDGTPGWAALDLRVGAVLDDRWSGVLAIENVSDVRYREHGSGVDAPGIHAALSVEGRF